jgi:hypothetical protein
MNTIEMQSITALAHLRAAILFVSRHNDNGTDDGILDANYFPVVH